MANPIVETSDTPAAISERAEAERLAALARYDILYTPAEAGFDDIVLLACQICETPVGLVSFVAGDRQWFKARIGFDPCQTPLEQSVCWHALGQPGLLIIPDLSDDPRTRDNTLVTGAPFIRFYAGARLETPEGQPLGTLCVIDGKPRPGGLTAAQATALEALARQVMTQMELRRTAAARDQALRAVQEGDLRRRQILASAIDYAIIAIGQDGRITDWNAGAERIFGWSADEMRGATAERFFTPEDRAADRVGHEMRRALDVGHGSDERWHLRKDGSRFWANGEMMPLRGEDGAHLGFLKIVRDETVRRQAAETLRVSEAFLRSVLASSDDCIKVLDLDANLVFMSEGGQRVMEVDDVARIKGCHWPGFWRDDLNVEAKAAIAAAKAGGSGHFQGLADTFAGTPKWWDVRVTPIRDAQGRPEKLLSISRDITDRKLADVRRAALLDLGDRLRDLTDPEEMAFSAAEIMGRTLAANRAGYGTVDAMDETVVIARDWTAPGVASIAGTHAFRDFGSFIDDLKQHSIVAIDDIEQDSRTASSAGALEAIGIRSIVNIPVFERGRFVAVFYLHGAGVRAWSPEQIAFARNVADRTRSAVERCHAERQLHQLNVELERRVEQRTAEHDQVWRNSRDLLALVGADGILRAANPAWAGILGYDPGEVVGHSFLEFVWPEDAGLSQEGLDIAVAERNLTSFENRYRHKDGTPRWISWHASMEGELVYAYGRNVTAEKERAAALLLTEEQLRQSQKMEAIGQLTGGVAHDFNNLLTVIRSSVDLLKRPGLSDERRRRYIDAISDTTTRAAKLTGQLLAFARRQALQPEVFDVGHSVRMMGDMVVTLTGSRIRIEIDVPPDACYIDADASQFDTALVNLAVNARDAMDGEGHLAIAVRTAARIPPMRSHPAVTGDFIAVSIADTGSGIAPSDIDRIFEPFFTTKGVGQGTGLGLSQVFGFVKQSGGEVAVESTLGQGTTFTLYLPRAGRPADETRIASDAEPLVHGHGTCVLVVEDNADVGLFSTQTLQELGYRTVLAADAQGALAELDRDAGRFDVVFSDVVMPAMNGIELGQEIRRRHPDLPMVLTSGYSHILAENGSYGFELLQKPYSIEQLSRVLGKAAAWRQRRRRASGAAVL